MTRGEKGESKGERTFKPAMKSLSALHSQEHPERFTELYKKEKREEGDRGDPEKKRVSEKGRELSNL